MKKYLLTAGILAMVFAGLHSQSYAFGLKGGLTLGTQKWNSFDRDPLFKYNFIAFIESAEETGAFSVFAQAGYHVKGSAIRIRGNNLSGGTFKLAQQFEFQNLSLVLGGKQRYELAGGRTKAYYLLGIRGDYTVATNLGDFQEFNERNPTSAIFPFEQFVQKLNYGVTVGGGFEFSFSEFVAGILEFTVNPDFSKQYNQPTIPNLYDPFTMNNRSIPERSIRNITLEVSLGIRFLHKIEYID